MSVSHLKIVSCLSELQIKITGITVSRIYCNSATHEAFEYVWEGFFKTVEKVTGKPIKFKVFDNSGTILSIILDMEAAQVQGLGTTILRMKLNGCKSNETNPDIIVQYLIKLCVVHWQRYDYNFVLSLSYLTAEL